MRVSLEYKYTCPKCRVSFFGSTLDEAYDQFHKHNEKCKVKVYSAEYYLVDEDGEPVDGLDEVLDQLYADEIIDFVD